VTLIHLPLDFPLVWQVSVSYDGDTVLVANPVVGYVKVYQHQGGPWDQTAELTPPDLTAQTPADSPDEGIRTCSPDPKRFSPNGYCSGFFGSSVAMSHDGTEIAVGAPQKTIGSNIAVGRVYLYQLIKSQWNPTFLIGPSVDIPRLSFGQSVFFSADGSTVFAASPTSCAFSPGDQGCEFANPNPHVVAPRNSTSLVGHVVKKIQWEKAGAITTPLVTSAQISRVWKPNANAKPGSKTYWALTSPLLHLSSDKAQTKVGSTIHFTTSGGNGAGVAWSVKGSFCVLAKQILTAKKATTCEVKVSQTTGNGYLAPPSSSLLLRFVK
jgi:hypothetical protein